MNGKTLVCVLSIVLVIALPVLVLFGICLPATATYNRTFGSHVVMAYDQATFEGMKTQVMMVWTQMNKTFDGFDYTHTYNTPWYWEQNYDNSLQANDDYLRSLTDRLNQTIVEKDQIIAGNKTIMIPYNTWYQQTLEGFRNESKREGGLDWAISGAWCLTFAPAAYWVWWWAIPLEIVFIIVALIGFFWASSY